MSRSGAPWRMLPAIRQVVQRVQALCQMERAGDIRCTSMIDPDMEHGDQHPCAAGTPHKKGDNGLRLLVQSRGFQHESACEC